jgi:hypothetical protein
MYLQYVEDLQAIVLAMVLRCHTSDYFGRLPASPMSFAPLTLWKPRYAGTFHFRANNQHQVAFLPSLQSSYTQFPTTIA